MSDVQLCVIQTIANTPALCSWDQKWALLAHWSTPKYLLDQNLWTFFEQELTQQICHYRSVNCPNARTVIVRFWILTSDSHLCIEVSNGRSVMKKLRDFDWMFKIRFLWKLVILWVKINFLIPLWIYYQYSMFCGL